MSISELVSLDFGERYLMYAAMLHMVKSNAGMGFVNNDQGHIAYQHGRTGGDDYKSLGDSPAHNTLYQMMKVLSGGFADNKDFAKGDLVTDWPSFCILATDANTKFKEA